MALYLVMTSFYGRDDFLFRQYEFYQNEIQNLIL